MGDDDKKSAIKNYSNFRLCLKGAKERKQLSLKASRKAKKNFDIKTIAMQQHTHTTVEIFPQLFQ